MATRPTIRLVPNSFVHKESGNPRSTARILNTALPHRPLSVRRTGRVIHLRPPPIARLAARSLPVDVTVQNINRNKPLPPLPVDETFGKYMANLQYVQRRPVSSPVSPCLFRQPHRLFDFPSRESLRSSFASVLREWHSTPLTPFPSLSSIYSYTSSDEQEWNRSVTDEDGSRPGSASDSFFFWDKWSPVSAGRVRHFELTTMVVSRYRMEHFSEDGVPPLFTNPWILENVQNESQRSKLDSTALQSLGEDLTETSEVSPFTVDRILPGILQGKISHSAVGVLISGLNFAIDTSISLGATHTQNQNTAHDSNTMESLQSRNTIDHGMTTRSSRIFPLSLQVGRATNRQARVLDGELFLPTYPTADQAHGGNREVPLILQPCNPSYRVSLYLSKNPELCLPHTPKSGTPVPTYGSESEAGVRRSEEDDQSWQSGNGKMRRRQTVLRTALKGVERFLCG